jgi:hypothetical protein
MGSYTVNPAALDFADVCQQVIIWQPLTGRDNYGKPTWGAPITLQGRRVFNNTRVAAYERGTKGQGPEVISSSQIWILATLTGLTYDDLVYVSGDAAPYPPVLDWKRYPDETGQDLYTKVMLGSANG